MPNWVIAVVVAHYAAERAQMRAVDGLYLAELQTVRRKCFLQQTQRAGGAVVLYIIIAVDTVLGLEIFDAEVYDVSLLLRSKVELHVHNTAPLTAVGIGEILPRSCGCPVVGFAFYKAVHKVGLLKVECAETHGVVGLRCCDMQCCMSFEFIYVRARVEHGETHRCIGDVSSG